MEELPKLEKVRGYCEAPAKPDFFDQSLLLIGGRNPLGQPNLKVGWGWDLRVYRNGQADSLKYPGPFLNRWILEKWLPPDFFGSRKHWELNRYSKSVDGTKMDLLGPYPRQGQYGMVMPLTTALGDFIPLSSEVLLFIDAMQSEFNSRTLNVYSDAKLYARLQEQMADQEAEVRVQQEKEAQDWEDYVRPREFELNQEPKFSLPSLWTPGGEHSIN